MAGNMPAADLAELRRRLQEISDLGRAGSVLSWDQSTYMPAGGGAARGRQMALLASLAHERRIDPELGRLLDRLDPYAASLPAEADDAALVRIARRDRDIACRVPAAHVARASAHASAAYQAWVTARPANDFRTMRPYLETCLGLSREYAGYFPEAAHVMDPLIGPDEGFTAAETRALFADLRRDLVPLVRAVTAAAPADDACIRQTFAAAPQLAFGLEVAQAFGYDLRRGRLDETAHPFCTKFAGDDVRITTRVKADDLGDCLFSTLHETGHALYELGVAPELDGTPLGHGTSPGVHESQSRLWENIVGRSLPFWQHWYPRLQSVFPGQLGGVPLAAFHRAINKVERSLIRTDADELTYNLHVMIRFDLECDMLEGRLAVADLPEAWRARYESDVGITPPDDRDGCLQDVHWCWGIGGMFQSYTIGNILSAQIYAAAERAHPEIEAETGAGRYGTLHRWLVDNVYRHGRKFGPAELIRRATGEPIGTGSYLAYLRGKYGTLYGLPN